MLRILFRFGQKSFESKVHPFIEILNDNLTISDIWFDEFPIESMSKLDSDRFTELYPLLILPHENYKISIGLFDKLITGSGHEKSRQGHTIKVFGPNERACYQYRTK